MAVSTHEGPADIPEAQRSVEPTNTGGKMADGEILSRIDELIAEERELRSRATGVGLTAEEQGKLGLLEQRLDQCWDLLRQRRARVEFNDDPAAAKSSPTGSSVMTAKGAFG
jgi:hypothetical protein